MAGEFLDLVRDDRKSAARLAGAGGLDGGVEREEVGLLRDLVDEFHDLSDLAGGLFEFDHEFARLARLRIGLAGDFRFLGAVTGHLLDGGGHFLHGGGDRGGGLADLSGGDRHGFRIDGEFFAGGGHGVGLNIGLLGSGGLGIRGLGENRGGFGESLGSAGDFLNHLAEIIDAGIHRIGECAQLVISLEIHTSCQVAVGEFLNRVRAGDDRAADRAADEERGNQQDQNRDNSHAVGDLMHALEQILLRDADRHDPAQAGIAQSALGFGKSTDLPDIFIRANLPDKSFFAL